VKRSCLNILFGIIGVILIVPLPCSGTSFLETFREQTQVLPKEELRAAWVVRHALNSREEIDRAVDYAARARFHLLFVQVRGRGDAYYLSELEPPAPRLERPLDVFDPLAYFLERAHSEGIAVHAWINVCYVWSNPEVRPPPTHVATEHPEWLMTSRDSVRMDERPLDHWRSRGLEGYYVSPGNPAVRKHTIEVVSDIVSRYPVDGVHLDYIRYPSRAFDFSPADRTEFALHYGVDPMLLEREDDELVRLVGEEDFVLLDSLRTEWRVSQVDSIVRMVRTAIGDRPLSAAVFPDFATARVTKGQDWLRWVHDGLVDFVVPMAYTLEPADLSERVRLIARTIGSDRFLVGLPVYDGKSSYLGYSVSLLRRQGVLGYSLFSYNALAEERFSLQFLERVFLAPE
jgi:uncharacterized lipoprotein YddW (UPF0748 family)